MPPLYEGFGNPTQDVVWLASNCRIGIPVLALRVQMNPAVVPTQLLLLAGACPLGVPCSSTVRSEPFCMCNSSLIVPMQRFSLPTGMLELHGPTGSQVDPPLDVNVSPVSSIPHTIDCVG